MRSPSTSTLTTLFLLLSLTTASPHSLKRQGGTIYAIQTYYNNGGCTGTSDTEATFGAVNLCQPIRSVLDSAVSVTVDSVTEGIAGCVVHYYTDSACTEGDTVGVVGQCEQASAPFVATNVICPN